MVKFFEFLTLRELENSEASPGKEHRGWLKEPLHCRSVRAPAEAIGGCSPLAPHTLRIEPGKGQTCV